MRLFPPLVHVDENEGFTTAKDIFGRRKIADELTHLVSNVEDPLVLAVDGQWGSGKTIFLRMWRGELQKQGFPVIYFDAYANDYFEDAFIPLAAEVVGLARGKLKANVSKYDEFKAKTIGATKVLLRSGLKIGVRAATLGILDTGEIEGTIADEIETAFDEHVGALITKKDQAKTDMETFKEALQNLPKLFSSKDDVTGNTKPIIVIIDELDRCKPTYALQLLERMKHFFSVPNIHFVLGVNLAQLSNSVVATYGSGIDGQLYLQKFIQLSVQLYDRFDQNQVTTSAKFLNHLLLQNNLNGKNYELAERCNLEILRASNHSNFSLRTLEQIYSHCKRVVAVIPENHFRNAAIISGLSILKVTAPLLFYKAKSGDLEYSDLVAVFGLVEGNSPISMHAGNDHQRRLREQRWFEHWWRFASEKDCSNEIIQSFTNSMLDFTFRDRMDILPWCANEQIDKFAAV